MKSSREPQLRQKPRMSAEAEKLKDKKHLQNIQGLRRDHATPQKGARQRGPGTEVVAIANLHRKQIVRKTHILPPS